MSNYITPVMLTDSTGFLSEITTLFKNYYVNHIYSYFVLLDSKHLISQRVKYNPEQGEITESYLIQNPLLIIAYSIYLTTYSEYKGNFDSAGGVASEWIVHNLIYDVVYLPNKYYGLGSDIIEHAEDFGVGGSVFDELDFALDSSRNDRIERLAVFGLSYGIEFALFTTEATNDLINYLKRKVFD